MEPSICHWNHNFHIFTCCLKAMLRPLSCFLAKVDYFKMKLIVIAVLHLRCFSIKLLHLRYFSFTWKKKFFSKFFEVCYSVAFVCLFVFVVCGKFFLNDSGRNFESICMKIGRKLRLQVESRPLTFGDIYFKVKVTARSNNFQKFPIGKHWE